MRREKNNLLHGIKIVGLLICVVIGGYGILKAPASDQEEMKRELMNNEKALKKMEATPQAETSETAKNAVGSKANGKEGQGKKSAETISVIGDSVFLGAAPAFQKKYKNAVIDAKISRQVRHGVDVAKKLKKKGKLGDTVIISLGTNGNFNSATGQELIDYLGKDRTIYWINAYGKKLPVQREVNRTIEKLAEENDNVYLISWAKEGKKHPNWFYQDGIHLNSTGQDGFARFVQKEMERIGE